MTASRGRISAARSAGGRVSGSATRGADGVAVAVGTPGVLVGVSRARFAAVLVGKATAVAGVVGTVVPPGRQPHSSAARIRIHSLRWSEDARSILPAY